MEINEKKNWFDEHIIIDFGNSQKNKKVAEEFKEKLKEKLKNEVLNLCLSIEKISEEDLDYYLLPHPILGKLTLREMLYFTIYHVKHHEKQIRS